MAKTVIDDSDRELVQWALDWIRRQRLPRTRPQMPEPVEQGASSYLVLTPADGVPALEFISTGTAYIPGFATCEVYRILGGQLDDQGFTVDAYNVGSAIPGKTWCLATLDKDGSYYLVPLVVQPDICPDMDTGTGTSEPSYTGTGTYEPSYWWCMTTPVDTGTGTSESLTGSGTDSAQIDECLLMTVSDKDWLVEWGWTCNGGPFLTQQECQFFCDTGTASDSTGTGTGSGSCPAVKVLETDVRCEAGALNLYQRVNYLKVVLGCLTNVCDPWTYIRTIACCDTDCNDYWWCMSPPENTGTAYPVTGTAYPVTGTGFNYASCLYMTEPQMNTLLGMGWTYHGGPYTTESQCLSVCTPPTGSGSGSDSGSDSGSGSGSGDEDSGQFWFRCYTEYNQGAGVGNRLVQLLYSDGILQLNVIDDQNTTASDSTNVTFAFNTWYDLVIVDDGTNYSASVGSSSVSIASAAAPSQTVMNLEFNNEVPTAKLYINQLSVGSAWYDTFTDADGTHLIAHTPNTSPGGSGYSVVVPLNSDGLEIDGDMVQIGSWATQGNVADAWFDPQLDASVGTVTTTIRFMING